MAAEKGGGGGQEGRGSEARPGREDRVVNVAGLGLGEGRMDGGGEPSATVHRWLPCDISKQTDRRTGGGPGAGVGF